MIKAKWVLMLVAAFGFQQVLAQKAKNAEVQSLLWEVSGNGLDRPSYLFGTIHMICKDDYLMKPKVEKAFAAAKNLILEIDLTDTPAMMGMMTLMVSEQPMSALLSDAEEARLDSALQAILGLPLAMLDHVSPGAVYLLLANSSAEAGCDSIKSYELELMQMAKNRNLPVRGLETIKDQIEMLNKVFDAKALLQELDGKTDENTEMNTLVAAYKAEDLHALHELINQSELKDPKTAAVLLTDRNKSWAEKMPALMQEGTQFFAVGAGHLSGSEGVLELLRKKGYRVTAIKD